MWSAMMALKVHNMHRTVVDRLSQFLALITSMTNGYDGSMMNGLQTLDLWQDYFNERQSYACWGQTHNDSGQFCKEPAVESGVPSLH
jgi:hypothetical protein